MPDPGEADLQLHLEQARAAGNLQAQGEALFGLGRLALARGDRARAVDLYQQSGLIWQELKAWPNLLSTLNNLAFLLMDVEDYDGAYKAARAATELAQRLGDPGAMAMAVNTLGAVANNTGDIESAGTAYNKGLELARTAADPARIARALYNLAWLAFATADYGEARRRSLEAAAALGPAVDPRMQAYIAMLGGRLDLRHRVYPRGLSRLGWAARTFHYTAESEGAALASFAFGAGEYLAGDRSEGRSRIEATFEGIRLNRNRRATAERLIGLSRLAAESGAVDDAGAFGQLALNIGTHLSDAPIETMARQLIKGGAYAGAGDPGISKAVAELDSAHNAGEVPEAPNAGDGADLKWLEHDLGVPPPAPAPAGPPNAQAGAEYVGPIKILDQTADGHGYSILQDVAAEIGVKTNHDVEASLRAVLQRRDPILLTRLEFDSADAGVGILAGSHEDIRTAATWLASMFKSAAGA